MLLDNICVDMLMYLQMGITSAMVSTQGQVISNSEWSVLSSRGGLEPNCLSLLEFETWRLRPLSHHGQLCTTIFSLVKLKYKFLKNFRWPVWVTPPQCLVIHERHSFPRCATISVFSVIPQLQITRITQPRHTSSRAMIKRVIAYLWRQEKLSLKIKSVECRHLLQTTDTHQHS